MSSRRIVSTGELALQSTVVARSVAVGDVRAGGRGKGGDDRACVRLAGDVDDLAGAGR